MAEFRQVLGPVSKAPGGGRRGAVPGAGGSEAHGSRPGGLQRDSPGGELDLEEQSDDFSNPTFRFFLGLALFLRCHWEESRLYLESAGKPREWFQGLPSEQAVVDKLKAFRRSDPVNVNMFAEHLEQLLSFGLPSLVFTFLDQTEILPEEVANSEVVALVDAKVDLPSNPVTTAPGENRCFRSRLPPWIGSIAPR
eukprot:Skav234325  [mRNA]  locus=scaffold3161:59874:69070:+ [translate_table: standard]